MVLPDGMIYGSVASQAFDYTNYSRSSAVFGQATYHLTDRLDLTGGVRHTADRTALSQATATRDLEATSSKTNWTAAVDYKLGADVMLYSRVATGYHAGGFNPRSSAYFEPDTATDYEAGFKSELLDHHLRFNADYYFSDYVNLQVNEFRVVGGGLQSTTVNAGHAYFQGFEAEVQALLPLGLSVDGNVGTSRRKYLQYLVTEPYTGKSSNIGNMVEGSDTPDAMANIGLQYDRPALLRSTLSARLDYHYRGRVFFSPSSYDSPLNNVVASPAYGLLDARITLRNVVVGRSRLTFSAWANNLADVRYRVFGIDFGPPSYSSSGIYAAANVWGPPRTVGVDVGAQF